MWNNFQLPKPDILAALATRANPIVNAFRGEFGVAAQANAGRLLGVSFGLGDCLAGGHF